jgi:methylmalonyl-CoA mutase N-terminal domain/subunit
MRFHTQTAGSSLTAQQPEGNIVRTALEALSAVLGGTQSLHTNGFDEALGLPTEASARLALRTQQIIAHETGITDTVDPLAGSWFVEALTDELESVADGILVEVDEVGGAVAAIEAGLPQRRIEDSAYLAARRLEAGDDVIVGVNRYQMAEDDPIPVAEVDPASEAGQVERLAVLRDDRDASEVQRTLAAVGTAARGADNLLPPMKAALAAEATLGEVSDVLRDVFGTHRPR